MRFACVKLPLYLCFIGFFHFAFGAELNLSFVNDNTFATSADTGCPTEPSNRGMCYATYGGFPCTQLVFTPGNNPLDRNFFVHCSAPSKGPQLITFVGVDSSGNATGVQTCLIEGTERVSNMPVFESITPAEDQLIPNCPQPNSYSTTLQDGTFTCHYYGFKNKGQTQSTPTTHNAPVNLQDENFNLCVGAQ